MNEKTPELSIIIPVYNTAPWLEKCLDSVVKQTYDPCEVIVVDDGSTDESVEIMRKYEEEYPNIKVYRKSNGGVSSARNYGLARAAGEYVTFVDSDDFVDASFAQELVAKAKKEKADVVICGHLSYYYGKFRKDYQIVEPQNRNQKELLHEFFTKQNCAHIIVTKLFRTELLRENNIWFEEGRLYEDMLFSFDVICAAKKFSFLEKSLYTYWRHTGSLSVDTSLRKFEDYEYGITKILQHMENMELDSSIARDISLWMKSNLVSLTKLWLNSDSISKEEFRRVFQLFDKLCDHYKDML